jgi:hypothetical protein
VPASGLTIFFCLSSPQLKADVVPKTAGKTEPGSSGSSLGRREQAGQDRLARGRSWDSETINW